MNDEGELHSIKWNNPRKGIKELATLLCHPDSFFPISNVNERAEQILKGEIFYRDRIIKASEWNIPSNLEEGLLSSWKFYYHSLSWLSPLRREYHYTSNESYKAAYLAAIRDWLDEFGTPPTPLPTQQDPGDYTWYDMSTAWRVMVIIGAISIGGPNANLISHLQTHARVLARDDYYAGVGNHALHQNYALLSLAMILNHNDYFQLSIDRIEALRPISIDDEGVSLEGSAGYHLFNLYWWSNMDRLLELVSTLAEVEQTMRIPDMRPFLRHVVAPDGKIVPLGDSTMTHGPYHSVINEYPSEFVQHIESDPHLLFVLTEGRRGEPLPNTMEVYAEGYWFSRSQTGGRRPRQQSHASIRFGHGLSTRVHAHDDAGAVTFYPGGIRVLEDGGMFGYYGGEKREFVKSNRAHNTILVKGRKYYRSAVSSLESAICGESFDQAEVRVTAIERTRWTRIIAHARDEDFLFLQDHVTTNGADYQQIFNLGDGFQPVELREGRVDAVNNNGDKVSILWLDDNVRIGLAQGKIDPLLGWRSTFEGELHPIYCVIANHDDPGEKRIGKNTVITLMLRPEEHFSDVCVCDRQFSTNRTRFVLHRQNYRSICEIYNGRFGGNSIIKNR